MSFLCKISENISPMYLLLYLIFENKQKRHLHVVLKPNFSNVFKLTVKQVINVWHYRKIDK